MLPSRHDAWLQPSMLPRDRCAHRAEDYPSHPIRLLIHTPPGSLVDVLGRLVGQELEPAARPERRRRDNRPAQPP